MRRVYIKKSDKKKTKENYAMKAVLTIELSYLFVILFSIFVMVVYTVFYYHDKNILLGAAGETAVLWAQLERRPDEYTGGSLEAFYQERINGKLIFFSGVSVSANQTEEEVEITVFAQKGIMKVTVYGEAAIVRPEEKIRKKRVVENWIEQEG